MGIIQLSEVTVRRGRSTVLEKWSLSVDSGEVALFCLFGENGCGKSTVIETAGLVPMENGKSTISGQLIRDSDGRRGRTEFGLCLQDDWQVMGDEIVGERLLDVAGHEFDVESLLKKWGLEHRIHDRIAMLSGGQRRKIAVLSGLIPALISDTPVAVLLDEPDSGLDEKSIDLLCNIPRDLH